MSLLKISSIKFIFLALLLQTCLGNAYDVPKSFEINESCKSFIEEIKNDYEFGWIQANRNIYPELNSNLDTLGKVYIFYYFIKRPAAQRLKNPILFLNGGPGFSSHGQQQLLNSATSKLLPNSQFDFIFMDQRGSGCSSPYPTGVTLEVIQSLKSWMSDAIVSDAEILRKNLIGQQKWKIFGQSFGSYIAFRYIENFPNSLLKVFTHGNAIGITDFERSYNRIYSQYRVTEMFNKKFPESKKKLSLLKIFLSDPTKCFKNSIRNYCGYEITTHFVYSLGYTKNWSHLNDWLKILVPSNSVSNEGLQSFVNHFITSPAFYYQESINPEVYGDQLNLALNLFGLIDWDTKPLTFTTCSKIIALINKKTKLQPDSLILNECQAPIQFNYEDKIEPFIRKIEPHLSNHFINTQAVLNNIKLQKIPVFSYSGEADCYVPKESFINQNKFFGKYINYTHFLESGHDGYAIEKRIFNDLK